MKNETTAICNSETCPSPINLVATSHITLNLPSQYFADSNIVLEALGAWLQPPNSRCGRKFSSQSQQDTLHFENVSLGDDGNAIISWHCSGKRSYSLRVMLNLKSFLIISVDLLSRPNRNTPTALPALTKIKYLHLFWFLDRNLPFMAQRYGMVPITSQHFNLIPFGLYMIGSRSITNRDQKSHIVTQNLISH